ncbi:MAG: ACT domain-containing protein [Spirochaetaceae bacterium]|jgi:ACT domain-containing protein|nr:ACT domain-containing protein [Spirochaetaceae bacterium]
MNNNASSKAIVTVVGNDSVGIISKVSGFLAERKVNIEDVNQSILSGYFVMMMMVDLTESTQPLETLKAELSELGSTMHVSMSIWHEDVFTAMHRI